MKFQSTFPRGERRITVRIRLRHPNFNPRSRVGNDRSDHVYGLRPYDISIHVPAWGTTEAVTVGYGQNLNFNPRSRVGNDICVPCNPGSDYRISIHVPAWGTTANFHKYSLLFYAINIIFLLFIIPSLFSLVLFVLLF